MKNQFSIDDFEDHTSGLWTFKGEIFDYMEIHAVLTGDLLAELGGEPTGSWRETLANFRLMAAAPQLLRLAKELRNKAEFLTQKVDKSQARITELETALYWTLSGLEEYAESAYDSKEFSNEVKVLGAFIPE